MFEIGCGKARNLNLALSLGLNYFGIDFVSQDIETANAEIVKKGLNKSGRLIEVKHLSVFDFNRSANFIPKNEDPICIFPFNALGNMGRVFDILENFNELNFDILVTTYKNDEYAIEVRKNYFLNCGYNGLKIKKDISGTIFFTEEGLKSIAFDKDYFFNIAYAAGYEQISIHDFGKIGLMFTLKTFPKKLSYLFNPQSSKDSNSVQVEQLSYSEIS